MDWGVKTIPKIELRQESLANRHNTTARTSELPCNAVVARNASREDIRAGFSNGAERKRAHEGQRDDLTTRWRA
jgi:hypothetical protein